LIVVKLKDVDLPLLERPLPLFWREFYSNRIWFQFIRAPQAFKRRYALFIYRGLYDIFITWTA
jgi:hypothetical protein